MLSTSLMGITPDGREGPAKAEQDLSLKTMWLSRQDPLTIHCMKLQKDVGLLRECLDNHVGVDGFHKATENTALYWA